MDAMNRDDRLGVNSVRGMIIHRCVWSKLAYQKVLLGVIATLGIKMRVPCWLRHHIPIQSCLHTFTRSLGIILVGGFLRHVMPLEESDR